MIIVGDSRGTVHSLKLSPNLRRRTKEAELALQMEDMFKFRLAEVTKLEKILSQVIQADVSCSDDLYK